MTQLQKVSLFLLRITLGWMFLYAGVTHVLDPKFAKITAGYLGGAKTFAGFYAFLASPALLPITTFVNEWGLTLIGVALILGLFMRCAPILGMILMALYYLPILDFPYPNAHSYIVDEHIVYIAALFVLMAFRAGQACGLEPYAHRWLAAKFPRFASRLR